MCCTAFSTHPVVLAQIVQHKCDHIPCWLTDTLLDLVYLYCLCHCARFVTLCRKTSVSPVVSFVSPSTIAALTVSSSQNQLKCSQCLWTVHSCLKTAFFLNVTPIRCVFGLPVAQCAWRLVVNARMPDRADAQLYTGHDHYQSQCLTVLRCSERTFFDPETGTQWPPTLFSFLVLFLFFFLVLLLALRLFYFTTSRRKMSHTNGWQCSLLITNIDVHSHCQQQQQQQRKGIRAYKTGHAGWVRINWPSDGSTCQDYRNISWHCIRQLRIAFLVKTCRPMSNYFNEYRLA